MSAKSFTEFSRSLSLLMTSLKNGQNGQTCVDYYYCYCYCCSYCYYCFYYNSVYFSLSLCLFLSVFGGTNFQLVGLLLPCRVNINVAALFFFLLLRAMLGGQLLLTRLTPAPHPISVGRLEVLEMIFPVAGVVGESSLVYGNCCWEN